MYFFGNTKRTKTQTPPEGMFEIYLQTATAPHKKPKAATVENSLTGVCQSVGYARWQSQAGKTDSRGDFVNSNLQAICTTSPTIDIHVLFPRADT